MRLDQSLFLALARQTDRSAAPSHIGRRPQPVEVVQVPHHRHPRHREAREKVRLDAVGVDEARGERRDLAFMCSGTHPFSDWAKQQISPNPRYVRLVEEMQWVASPARLRRDVLPELGRNKTA